MFVFLWSLSHPSKCATHDTYTQINTYTHTYKPTYMLSPGSTHSNISTHVHTCKPVSRSRTLKHPLPLLMRPSASLSSRSGCDVVHRVRWAGRCRISDHFVVLAKPHTRTLQDKLDHYEKSGEKEYTLSQPVTILRMSSQESFHAKICSCIRTAI